MKKTTSNKAPVPTEEQLRAASSKALVAEKAAKAVKDKARTAKRRLKEARKAYKAAKKAAKKALKRALKAQEELQECADRLATGRKKLLAQRRGAKRKSHPATAAIATTLRPAEAARTTQSPVPAAEADALPEIPAAPDVGTEKVGNGLAEHRTYGEPDAKG